MKKHSLLSTTTLLAVMLFLGCTNIDKPNSPSDNESKPAFDLADARKGIEESVGKFAEAVSKGDSLAASNFYTSDAKFMAPNAPSLVGRENIVAGLSAIIQSGFTKLVVKTVDVWVCGEYVTEEEEWTLSNGKVASAGKSLVLWKKEDGVWKMHRDMLSSNSPASPAK